MKKKITGFMACFILFFGLLTIPSNGITAQAASYAGDYRYWSQGGSDYWGMRSYGCWIVAQAKLLYEANIERSASFNPDTYYQWQVNNGCMVNPGGGDFNQTDGGNAPVKYAKQKGKNLEYLGYWDASDSQLWYNINAGYYTILAVSGHYVMIANEMSKATGQLYCYDSFTDRGSVQPQLITRYPYHVAGYVYKADNHSHSYTSSVTKQPTCTAVGTRTYKCACGNSYTEQIAATGHKYVSQKVAPTTTQKGYTLHKCSVCGSSYKDNYVDPPVASGSWYYCDSLPSGITSANYTIEYNNYYEKTQSTSPGSGWTNAGTVKNEWQNSGAQYESNSDLPVSDERVLLSTYYYHWCGPNAGNVGNYEASGNFTHYDWIPADWVSAQYVENDNGYPVYLLYWSDGNQVYCKTGDTCDGTWGSHGTRCKAWYKKNVYQDRTKVVLYKYTKESGWTDSKDSSATKVTCRYKAKVSIGSTPSIPKVSAPSSSVPSAQAKVDSNTASKPSVQPSAQAKVSSNTTSKPATQAKANPVSAPKQTAQAASKSATQQAVQPSAKAAPSLEENKLFIVGSFMYNVTKGGTSGEVEVEVARIANSKLTSVVIPDTINYKGITCKVTRIDEDACSDCKNLKKVIIGKNVKSIGAKAFLNCKKLKNITIKSTKLKKSSVGSKAFKNINGKAVVKVPSSCVKTYKKILKAKGAGKKVKVKK